MGYSSLHKDTKSISDAVLRDIMHIELDGEVHLSNNKGLLSQLNSKAWAEGNRPTKLVEFTLFSDVDFIGSSPDTEPYGFVNLINYYDRPQYLKDVLLLRAFWYLRNDLYEAKLVLREKTETSEYHGGGLQDEIAALVSLRLGVRVRSGNATRTFDLSRNGDFGEPHTAPTIPAMDRISTEYVVPCARKQVSLSNLPNLGFLFSLSRSTYSSLIKSARLYQEALLMAETEPQYAWLLLCSAIEVAAANQPDGLSSVDAFVEAYPDVTEWLKECGDEELVIRVGKKLGRTQRATKKFVDLLAKYCPAAPDKRPPEKHQVLWEDEALRVVFRKLYKLRSDYLHNGTPFPEYMCAPPFQLREWDAPNERGLPAGSVSGGGGFWLDKDAPISLNTFTYIVQGALSGWWDDLLNQQEVTRSS